jgi:hypothetical protein
VWYRDAAVDVNGNLVDLTSSTLGGRVFLQHDIVSGIFARGELELFQTTVKSNEIDFKQTNNFVYPLIGAGINQGFGKRGGVSLMILYNLNYNADDELQPYASPWVTRVGLGF